MSLDINELLNFRHVIQPEIKQLVAMFISPTSRGKRYAFGRNEHSETLAKTIEIDAFIDDFAPSNSRWNGKPVIKKTEIPNDAIIVNCVMSISPVTVKNLLKTAGLKKILTFSDLCHVEPHTFKFPQFVLQTRKDLEKNKYQWQQLADNLSDYDSEKVLVDVLKYRITADCSFMSDYSVRFKEQYFEKFLKLGIGEVFADCGGFDGDTSDEFIARYPNYKKIFFFEPSLENLMKAKKRLFGKTNIDFIGKGVSDKEEILKFNLFGSASIIDENGDSQIEVTSIDNCIKEKISFIKMDLEGWELKALRGTKEHLINDHPKLAVAVYHNASDFWQIFKFIKSVRSDYAIYLRHYTEGWSETIMFFVPI